MAQYVVAIWRGTDGPAVDYRKARSAVAAVDTLIERINWVGVMNGEKDTALSVARGWVPSKQTPRISVKIGLYEIEAYKVAA